MNPRPVVVVYDVADDRRRAHVRDALAPVADRFQQSGWLVPAHAGLSAPRVVAGLEALLRRGDRLRAYEPCVGCRRTALWLPDGGRRMQAAERSTSGWVAW